MHLHFDYYLEYVLGQFWNSFGTVLEQFLNSFTFYQIIIRERIVSEYKGKASVKSSALIIFKINPV
jgi:hypothetical protein